MKIPPFSPLRWSRGAFYLLLVTLPFGTRWIVAQGYLAGVPVEWGTISITLTQVLALVVVILAACHAFQKGHRAVLLRRSGTPALLLVVVGGIATIGSTDPVYAATVTCWILLGALLASALRITQPAPRSASIAFVIGTLFQAGLGLRQFFAQDVAANVLLGVAPHVPSDLGAFVVETTAGRLLRAYGTLPHPNILGALLMAAIIVAFTAADFCGKRARIALVASLPVLTAALFFTYSRGAWLGLLFALTVLLLGRRRHAPNGVHAQATIYIALAIISMTAVILTALHHDAVRSRMRVEGRLEQRSVQERQEQYSDAVRLFVGNPMFGIGPGQMPVTLAGRDTTGGHTGWEYQPIHNVPALITVELGITGLLLWLAVVVSSFVAARTRGDELDAYRLAFRSIFLGLLVMSLFDHYLWSLWTGQLMFWIGIGMLWAFKEKVEE